MPPIIPDTSAETEGKRFADAFQSSADLERLGKPIAIRCLNAAIESFIVARHLSRRQVAEDLCGMSEANFSKVVNGQQGDFWALVYKLPADVRGDFFDRLSDTERVDPLAVALEQLNAAMFRVMRLTHTPLPAKATRNAKAALADRKQRSA